MTKSKWINTGLAVLSISSIIVSVNLANEINKLDKENEILQLQKDNFELLHYRQTFMLNEIQKENSNLVKDAHSKMIETGDNEIMFKYTYKLEGDN